MAMIRGRWTLGGACGLTLLAVCACGKKTPAPDSPQGGPERTARVAQPCLELGDAPVNPSNARVFVEVAEVSEGALPEPIGKWLQENPVRVRSTANVVAFPNVPTSTPWGQCVDSVCSTQKGSITITARLPARASEPI